MIGRTLGKLHKLEQEKNALKARVETLEYDLAASDALAEALEAELAKLRTSHGKESNFPGTDVEENEKLVYVHLPCSHAPQDCLLIIATSHLFNRMSFKDLNTDEKNTSSSDEQVVSLRASLDRLQRKYDRLLAKKEAAEQRFYASYVDWHNFKGWWAGFSKFPGISRRMLTYNRAVKNGAWIPDAGQGFVAGGKGRILKVIEAAEKDPTAFPNVVREEAESHMETDEKFERSDGECALEDQKRRLQRVCQEAEEICNATTAPATHEPPSPREQTPPSGGNTTPVALAKRPMAGKGDEGREGVRDQDDASDSDKTQETTPAKSQAQPFWPDLSGLKPPRIDL